MSRSPLFSRSMAGIGLSVSLFVFFLFALSNATAAPFATTVITPASPNGWLWALESGTNGSVSFVNGPATPPAGTGSARFQTGNSSTGVVLSRNGVYPGLRFDDITALTYDLYKSASASATNDIIFQVNVDYDLTDSTTSWQGRLVYEPYYSAPLPAGTWTTVDPLTGGEGWWATGAPGNGACPISNPCTWAEVLAAFPDAGIQTGTLAALHFKAGSGWSTPFDGNVDNFHIVADGGIDDTYDFEAGTAPGAPCTTTCYVSTLGNNSNGGASAGDPLRNIQTGVNQVSTGGTVIVSEGVYVEKVTIPKTLELTGAGSDSDLQVNTILEGTGLSGHAITINSNVTDVTIEDLRVQNFATGSGIHGTAGNNGLTVQGTALYANNTTLAVNGGGLYMNGPVSDVLIDDNEVVGNRARGIVIWNGFKQDITITNNYVANNNCCGIELQDGTASGVTVTGNVVENNGDSGMAFIGLRAGAGPNLISGNTLSNNGRFGIEIKLPDGNGTDSGDGSIVVENNNVSLSVPIPGAEVRDLAGISVYRRGWVAGNGNVDIPVGVVVRSNTVGGYQQPSTSDGFGIVVEGTDHVVSGNTLNNNDVGVQSQGGHLPYTPNSNVDGNQNNLNDQYFGRGNAPIGCPVTIGTNTFAGNSTDTRFVGYASNGYRATNIDTGEQFCTIQAAINDADTVNGHTIVVSAGTHVEQIVINKEITLEGAQAGILAKDRAGPQSILRWSGSGVPISLADDNITIDGFVLNAQGASTSWIINAVGEPGNGVYENIHILNNEFIGDAGPHTAQNDPGGAYFVAATDTLFEGNYFNELGSHAVFMGQTSDGTTYRDNDSYRNYLSGFSVHTGPHTNVVIEDNRSVQDSMILFNMDGAVVQNNVFTATATTSARVYLGGGSSDVTVEDNDFNGVRSAAIISFNAGFGYGGNSDITITDNDITATVTTLALTDVGLIDIRDTTGTNHVSDNTVAVESGTLGVNAVYGISLRGAMGNTTISANTISGNDVDTSPATPSIGIYLQSSLGAGSTTTIENNTVNGWNSGVEAGTLVAGLTATVYENDLSGNTPNAIANGAGALLNASANWYGTTTPTGVAALVSSNVDYTPWFDDGTDTDGGTAGWQGDFSWFNADNSSPQTGSVGRINEAVALVTTGGTVNLAPGIYNETATIPKSLTLQGAGAGTTAADTVLDGNSPSTLTGNGITLSPDVANITVQTLRVQDYGTGASGGSGIKGARNNGVTIQDVHTYNNNGGSADLSGNGGIYFNGPIDDVLIDGNESVGNKGRGIVIWDGNKTNITITDNLVTNNNCCGIELQDGTASGVTMTGNTVSNNGDSGMAAIGLESGAGANLIAGNTLTDNGRFGIEIKLTDGSGLTSGDGSIVVENNIVSRTSVPSDARDLAGISVYRRGWTSVNVDIPTGVVVRNNTVSGYQQTTQSDGFGIVVEGTNHQVINNTLNNNDVGVQVQGGHLPYTPNGAPDGDQSNLNDQFFGRGNAPYGCAVVTGNTFSGNSTDTRSVGNGGVGMRATNTTTSETFCTIQAAIDDADTVAGHTIEVEAGTWEEQIEIYKAITLEGQGEGTTTIVAPMDMPKFFLSPNASPPPAQFENYPIIYIHDVNATVRDLTVDGDGRGNLNYRFMGVAFEQAGGTLEDVTITGMTNTPFNGTQHGNGIWGRANNGTARTLTVTNVTITDFQKNGTVFSGADLTVTMNDSTVEGSGPLGTGMPAQNGIQLSGGASGSFDNNTVSDINYTPGSWASIGILVTGSAGSTQVTNNTILDTKNAIDFREAEGDAIGNTISNTAANMGATTVAWGITVFNQVAAPPFAEFASTAPAAVPFADGSDFEAKTPDSALLNRDYTIEDNTLNGAGFGYGIGLYALASESTTIVVNDNAVDAWEGGVDHYTTTSLDTDITANTITDSDYGIYFSGGTSTITNNTIDNNGVGIWVDGGTVSPVIFENSITSIGLGVDNTSAGIAVVNASANWWGNSAPNNVAAEVSSGVDYTPWFNDGTDTDGGTAGWQGNFSWFNADDSSPQTGSVGRINEAIALVTTGGTVNLAPGTYNETSTVPKSLTLQGAGAGTDPNIHTILDGNTPANQTGNGITVNSGITNVTIQDMRVQDFGGTASGSGIFGTLGNNNFTVQRTDLYNNNLSNAGNGGGLYMNGPVNTVVIDDNNVVNNRSRGIVIWNGFKQNITITDNYVANNICCGIELQDGTASGVTVTGNVVENNGDSGLAFIGLQGGAGANLIAGNTVTDNGRFGIEIKLPDGNGTISGDGSIVVENNIVSRTSAPADARDVAGISVYRRGWVLGNGNVDIPVGVVVRNNTVNGYQQPTVSDGFGIVVEGTNHQVLNNTLNNNDVGVQVQGGHLPYTPNSPVDGDQSNLPDQFFGRGNAPLGCPMTITGNIYSGNTTNTRYVGNAGESFRATNTTTNETFCTIQAAIDDTNTVAGHTIEVEAGTWEEQVEVYKAITLQGQGEGVTTILSPVTLTKFFVTSVNNYPIIYVHDVNATIEDLTVDGAGRGNSNNRFIGIGFRNAGGAVNDVTITDIRHTPMNGVQGGVGIYAFADNGTARTLAVDDATILGFQKNGTAFNGINLTATMVNSTVTGSGPLGFIAQNGIQWGFGSTGSASNNTISNIGYTPTTDTGAGYLLYQTTGTVVVADSDITNTQVGVSLSDSQANVLDNAISNTLTGMGGTVDWWGILLQNSIAAPLTGDMVVPAPFGAEDVAEGFAPELVNRTYQIEGNTLDGSDGADRGHGLEVYSTAPDATSVTVNANTFTDWINGIYNSGGSGAGTITATANTIESNTTGINIEGGAVTATNNFIRTNDVGVRYEAGAEPEIHENDLSGNTTVAVQHADYPTNTTLVDTSANWYGDNNPGGVAVEVTDGVDYTPWFTIGTDISGVAGWQGNYNTLHADDDSPQTGTVGRLQEAVNLVNATGLVYAEPGTYEETVSINGKDLTVEGRGEGVSTVLSPITVPACWDSSRHPIICVQNTANVTFRDLTVDGDQRGSGNSGFYGIAYRNAGGTVENVSIPDITGLPVGADQSGVALYACADNGTARTLTVDNVTLTGFDKNGTAFNCEDLTVTMSNSTIVGGGVFTSPLAAQNGIQLAFGATGTFTNNTISNLAYFNPSDEYEASAYLLYQAAGTTSITGSDLTNVEVGAYAYNSAMTFNNNMITQTTAGLPGMPTWYGVFIVSDSPTPLTPKAKVQPEGEQGTYSTTNVMMNRAHLISGNTMTSEGRVGTAIGTDVDALEVTSLNILTNTIETWEVGIEFEGNGLIGATVDDNYIGDNAVGVVIRTGVMNIINNAITVNHVGIRYFDSDGVSPQIHGNDIDYNTSWGVEHATFLTQSPPTIIDASSNYWGDTSGPLDTQPPFSGACPSLPEYNPTSTGNPVTQCVKWAPPLVVTLANFEATARPSDILVTWETASETDNLGFNLYRAITPDGTPEQLNEELIPSQSPGNGQGAMYEWEDVHVSEGITYYYWLEAVDIYGAGSPLFGPVSATYGLPTAVTLGDFNAQPVALPALLAAGLLLFGAIGVVVVRRRKA